MTVIKQADPNSPLAHPLSKEAVLPGCPLPWKETQLDCRTHATAPQGNEFQEERERRAVGGGQLGQTCWRPLFLLGQRQLRRPVVGGCREPQRPLNRKSPAWVSRLRLGTGGTDGVQAHGSGDPPGLARWGRPAAEASAVHSCVCSIKFNTLELAT